MTGPSVFFYVQHLLGIGHLARASRIARAMLNAGMRVTLVTGGNKVPGFPGDDIPHLALPPVSVADGAFKGLVTETGERASDAFLDARKTLLLEAFHRLKPDIVMIEAFPFGRRPMRFELHPLMDAVAAAHPRPALVTSLRDILQQRGRADRDQETVDIVRSNFDLVLVHGDTAFATLGDSFPCADQIADRVEYTGLVVPQPPGPATEQFDVLVSAGGGAVGTDLIQAAVEAAALMPDVAKWCIITGPNRPPAEFDSLSRRLSPNVQLARFRPDLASLMTGARLSVSQAGYNTVGDILQSRCNALVVPFTGQGETEQADRARRLAHIGRVAVLADDTLTGPTLAAAIRRQLDTPLHPADIAVGVDGARRSAAILSTLHQGSVGDRFAR